MSSTPTAIAAQRAPGLRAFLVIWAGQAMSFIGSQVAGFALGVWFFQRTGAATAYGVMALAAMLPTLVLAAPAGVIVDRYDRRKVLAGGHAGAALCSLLLAVAQARGALDLRAGVILVALASSFQTVQVPCLSAMTTDLVPAKDRGRANGLIQLGVAVGQIVAGLGAGMLLPVVGMSGILLLDVASFAAAIGALAAVRTPPAPARAPPSAPAASASRRETTTWSETIAGARFLARRPGLLGLLALFAIVNFNFGIVEVLIAPFILSFTDARTLGIVTSIGGSGMLIGSVVMAAWGGPTRRAKAVLACVFVQGLLLCLTVLRASAPAIAVGAFAFLFLIPLATSTTQWIWQLQVPSALQGRVFAVRAAVSRGAIAIATAIAGPLADRILEPMMAEGGRLAPILGPWTGTGRGRGMALCFAVVGLLTMLSAIAGYASSRLRRLDDETGGDDGA